MNKKKNEVESMNSSVYGGEVRTVNSWRKWLTTQSGEKQNNTKRDYEVYWIASKAKRGIKHGVEKDEGILKKIEEIIVETFQN